MSRDGKVMWRTNEEPPFNQGGAVHVDGPLPSVDGNRRMYSALSRIAKHVMLDAGYEIVRAP